MAGTRGRFSLVSSGSDNLFDYYDIERISLVVGRDDDIQHRIKGRGTYMIGGEFALMHRMELLLSIDGGEVEHLDSGLVAGGSEFPESISISLSRGSVCFDIWMNIEATVR